MDIRVPMCLKQDSKSVFLLLEENMPESPDSTEVHHLVSRDILLAQCQAVSLLNWRVGTPDTCGLH